MSVGISADIGILKWILILNYQIIYLNVLLLVVLADIGDIIAYRHGLHFYARK